MTSVSHPDRDRAARWFRVSTLKQDERNQEPDVDAWIEAHDYELAECGPEGDGTYRLKASASKGKQQEMLDLVIEDMREKRLDVLVVWKSNRIERRGVWNAFDLARKVRDAGGRIEYVQDAYLNDTSSMSDMMLALAATKDKQYSEDLGKAIRAGQARIRSNNGVHTDLPWGYKAVGPRYAKVATPTNECREYWPQVLTKCADGDSCRIIGGWLDSEGVKTDSGKRWHEDVIRRLIKNPVYCGRRLGWKDTPLLKDEAVVSVDLWERANKALSNRPKRGPRKPRKNPKPMLANLKCARCGSPMWRIHKSSRDREHFNYRCNGSGPQRKGCGNVVDYERLEQFVVAWFETDNYSPHRTRQWVDGKNWDTEISDIKLQMKELDPESDEDEARRSILKAQLREYRWKNEHEATQGGYEYTEIFNPDGSVMTVNQYFSSLDNDGKREYLIAHDICAEKGGDDDIIVVIDGRQVSERTETQLLRAGLSIHRAVAKRAADSHASKTP